MFQRLRRFSKLVLRRDSQKARLGTLLGLVLERPDFAVELPKLYVVTIDQLFGAHFRRVVVRAVQINGLHEMAVVTDMYARYSAIGPFPSVTPIRLDFETVTSAAAIRESWPIRQFWKRYRPDAPS